jgi:hypothetical protein
MGADVPCACSGTANAGCPRFVTTRYGVEKGQTAIMGVIHMAATSRVKGSISHGR